MDKEVRRTQDELARALKLAEERLKAVTQRNKLVHEELCSLTQQLETLESKSLELTKLDANLCKEESEILGRSEQREEAVRKYQKQLRDMYSDERVKHKQTYSGLLTSIKQTLEHKEEYDAVALFKQLPADWLSEQLDPDRAIIVEQRES